MRLRWFYALLLLLAGSSGLSGCEIINPDEDTPTYLKINKINLDPAREPSGTYFSASAKISDVWIYANGKEVGTFELPATIPILEKGDVRLDFQAGVYIDGLKGNRVKYPFFNQQLVTLPMEPGKVTEYTPEVKFKNNIVFPFNVYDDFTNGPAGNTGIRLNSFSPYKLEVNTDTLTDFEFANGWVGVVYGIPGNKERIHLESAFSGLLPANNSPVFLELDYKSTMNFEAGVAVNTPNQPAGELRDKEIIVARNRKWNRIYIDLTNEVNKGLYRGGSFRIILEGIPSGTSNEYLAIDNVRLIQFKP